MPRLLPPYISRDCKSTAEKLIFELFRTSPFAENWIILHSLNLSQHTIRLYGEIDFLILIPRGGVYVMEVKGGDVKCRDGVWYFTDRYGNVNKNKSPFTQARDAMFSLQVAISREFGRDHRFTRILSGFFCSFPHINFDLHSVEYEPWQIMDRSALQQGTATEFFQQLVMQTIQKHREQRWFSESESLPAAEDLLELCNFLRGDFERIRTARERLAQFDGEVKKYTEEQYRILDSISLNDRSVIQGSAGTGKTMIAIESAIRAAAEGKTVFLTCYNRLIGEWMQRQLEGWKDRIVVSSLHLFMFQQSKGFDYDQSQENTQNFYNRYLPLLLKDIYQKGISKKFDKLIIDEAQDLIRPEYLALFDAMITGGLSKGNWEFYGDFERQAIYSQLSKPEMLDLLNATGQHARFLLTRNCRNTRQIGEETALISGFEKPPFLLEHLEGLAVEYYFYKDNADQEKRLAELLQRMKDQQLAAKEVIIISPRRKEFSCANGLIGFTITEIKNTTDILENENVFGFATIQAYKGMESSYVVITDIEDLRSETAKSLLYTGMSRAKYGLTLLLAETVKMQYQELLKQKLS